MSLIQLYTWKKSIEGAQRLAWKFRANLKVLGKCTCLEISGQVFLKGRILPQGNESRK